MKRTIVFVRLSSYKYSRKDHGNFNVPIQLVLLIAQDNYFQFYLIQLVKEALG